jgi:hypothetical protein
MPNGHLHMERSKLSVTSLVKLLVPSARPVSYRGSIRS